MPSNKKYYWLKLHEEFFNQTVMKYIRKLPDGDTITIIYLKLLLKSLKTEGYIYFQGFFPTIEEEIALDLGEELVAVQFSLAALEKVQLLERGSGDSKLCMTKLPEMVGSETVAAVRMRNLREKRAIGAEEMAALPDKGNNVTSCSPDVTGCYPNVPKRYLEVEKDKETEQDRESETEIETEETGPKIYGVNQNVILSDSEYESLKRLYPDYSVFGGIPYYNRLVDDSISVEENLLELLVAPEARLENEVSMYLNAEISKITNANEVFEALSRGYTKYKDILDQSHVSSGPTLVDVLDKLSKMEVVEKRTPINDEGNKRKASYHISDPLSAFYYRYIFRYASQRKIMDPSIFYEKYIREDFESFYVSHYFEEICKQYLIRKNRAGEISPVIEKIGKYYYDIPSEKRNGEFDVVTQDENGYVFYEVKFRKETIPTAIVREEIEQVKATGMNCYKYVFVSKSPVDLEGIEETVEVIRLTNLWN